MNKRQRKKKILNGLSTEERYSRTHCPICKEKIGVFDEYFNTYGFCSVNCGHEYYKRKRKKKACLTSLEGKIMEVVDKESMKRISEVMLAATVSVEEAAGALKEIALSWPSAEYNSNGEIRGISRLRL